MGFTGRRKSAMEIRESLASGVVTQGPGPMLDLIDATLGGQTVIALPYTAAGTPMDFPQNGPAVPVQPFEPLVIVSEDQPVVEFEGRPAILLRAPGLYQVSFQASFKLDSAAPTDILTRFQTSRDGILEGFAWFDRVLGPNVFHPYVSGVIVAREDTFLQSFTTNLTGSTTGVAYAITAQSVRVG